MVKSFSSKVVDKFVQVCKESEIKRGEGEARERRGRGEGEARRRGEYIEEKKEEKRVQKINLIFQVTVPQHEFNKEYVQTYLVTTSC